MYKHLYFISKLIALSFFAFGQNYSSDTIKICIENFQNAPIPDGDIVIKHKFSNENLVIPIKEIAVNGCLCFKLLTKGEDISWEYTTEVCPSDHLVQYGDVEPASFPPTPKLLPPPLISITFMGLTSEGSLPEEDTICRIYVDNVEIDLYRVKESKKPEEGESRRLHTLIKRPELLSIQTVSATVLSPKKTHKWDERDLREVLRRVPGLNILGNQLDIRGGSGYSYGAGSRALLLLDGLPILTGDAGFPAWHFLPLENIEQIEIIKGAVSSLYGSSALNGVVNLRTASADSKPHTQASLYTTYYQNPRDNRGGEDIDTLPKAWWAGELPPYQLNASFVHRQKFGQAQKWQLAMGGNLHDWKSWRATEFHRRGRMHLKLGYEINTNTTLGINTNIQGNTTGHTIIWNGSGANAYRLWEGSDTLRDNGFKMTLDPYFTYEDEKTGISHKIMGRYYKHSADNDNEKSTFSDLMYGEYQAHKDFTDIGLHISAGATATHIVASGSLYQDQTHKSDNMALYLQADKRWGPRLNVSLGSRLETNAIDGQSESKPIMRIGANYEVGKSTYLRASFGQGYRYPTIAEKFVQTNLGVVDFEGLPIKINIFPNPDLQSETGWTAELGIRQELEMQNWDFVIDAAAFLNEYQNMTEFTFVVDSSASSGTFSILEKNEIPYLTVGKLPEGNTVFGFQSINIGDTRIAGADISMSGSKKILRDGKIDLLLGYTYSHPIYKNLDSTLQKLSSSDKNILKYRLRHTFKSDLTGSYRKFKLGIAVNYHSTIEAIDKIFESPALELGIADFRNNHASGVWVADMRFVYSFKNKGELSFICQNILNNEYTVRPALIEAPRNFSLKYTHGF